ncbi:MAG: hypothetical protein DM484_01845 [Candidatus Methylumidiphilus alinenensis]|uniref:Uncharacterized protein n=1 Tax=Candidatus Methylumidiphilus alinenensis TaxID=2202197 RepID=A0A2W4TKY2_9GAMM|nr:MAG: hypothetical protein DM484_01845 [Candidatus Methylumidiphilus alinenensis]
MFFIGYHLNGLELEGPIAYGGRVLTVNGRNFTLGKAHGNVQDSWIPQASLPSALAGTYAVNTTGGGGLQSISVGDDGILVNATKPGVVEQQGGKIAWSDGPPTCRSGQVNLLLDAVTLYPGLFGSVETGSGNLHKCIGKIMPPSNLRRPEPEFGLSPQAWQYLLSASVNGTGFFWHQWEKSNLAAQLINQTLAKILP